MLSKYSPQVLERQRTKFPDYISTLETLSKGQDMEGKRVLALVIHDLRNELTIVAMVFELQDMVKPDNVPCEVL